MDLCELGTSVGVCDAVGAALKNWTVSKLATLSDLSSEELQSILERRAGRAVSEEEISSFSALVAAADVWASSSRISHTGLQSLEWTGVAIKLAHYHRFSPLLPCVASRSEEVPVKRQRVSGAAISWKPGEHAEEQGFACKPPRLESGPAGSSAYPS